MSRFLQATAYGLLQGGLLGLVGIGFSLVWGVMNVVNVAHGAFVVVGAYVAWEVNAAFGLDPFVGMFLAAAVLFVVGYALQRGLINQVVNAPIWMTLLLTFGLELLLVQGMTVVFTGNLRSIPTSYASHALTWGSVRIPIGRLLGALGAVLLTVVLTFVINRTKAGLAIRATGMDRGAARLMGMNVRHIYALTFGLAAAMAGAAGAVLGTIGTFTPVDAGRYTLESFVVTVLGGLGNMSGALAGGLLLGLVEQLGGQYLSGTLVYAFSFGVLVLVLIIRPSGLIGRPFYEARVEAA
jgi:branched-chain amino acid transport system permease protein